MLDDARGELSALDKTVLDRLEAGTILSRRLEPALDGRLIFDEQMANRVARFGGSWPLILVFVGVLGGMDRHERSGPAAAALRSLTLYPPQLDAVLRRHPAGANHHDEPAPAGNPEPPAGRNRISHQSED
jgi:hypothetical protein